MNELYKSNIKGKLYKLMYEMNKDIRITVRTAVGDSNKELVGETVTQGSLEGAVISTNNISNGIEDFFKTSEHEVFYGTLKLQPFAFLDDIERFAHDPVEAQYGMINWRL